MDGMPVNSGTTLSLQRRGHHPGGSEPLQSIDQTSWTIFINGIMGELNTVLRKATMMPEERIKVNPTMGLTSSMLDTLKLAEQSLLLPKQEEESNSMVE
jgi:hypothetical protein